jgi:hypothetical protein
MKDPVEQQKKAREKIAEAAAMGNNAGMQAFAILQLADAIVLHGSPQIAANFDWSKLSSTVVGVDAAISPDQTATSYRVGPAGFGEPER